MAAGLIGKTDSSRIRIEKFASKSLLRNCSCSSTKAWSKHGTPASSAATSTLGTARMSPTAAQTGVRRPSHGGSERNGPFESAKPSSQLILVSHVQQA